MNFHFGTILKVVHISQMEFYVEIHARTHPWAFFLQRPVTENVTDIIYFQFLTKNMLGLILYNLKTCSTLLFLY